MGAGDFGSGECAEPHVAPDGHFRDADFARAAAATIIAASRSIWSIYYAGRTQLPPDETNGNTPLVSTFEVAWYSWKETKDARLPEMIARRRSQEHDRSVLPDAGAGGYRSRRSTRTRSRRMRSGFFRLQRPTGSGRCDSIRKSRKWSFRPGMRCGRWPRRAFPGTIRRSQKAIEYLLGRQQEFGGWFDPLQSFENFRTPFRETQFAVLALSSYLSGAGQEQRLEFARACELVEGSGAVARASSTGCGMARRPALVQADRGGRGAVERCADPAGGGGGAGPIGRSVVTSGADRAAGRSEQAGATDGGVVAAAGLSAGIRRPRLRRCLPRFRRRMRGCDGARRGCSRIIFATLARRDE